MAGLWSRVGTGVRLGIPAAAICAIVVSRIPAKAHRISDRIRPDDDEGDFEPYMYSEYPFPGGRCLDPRTSSRRRSA